MLLWKEHSGLVVLEQGVVAIPLSIDLWMYYIGFAKERYKGVAGEGRIRQLFGRASEAAGLDFRSDELWDAYIQWEKSIRQLRNVFAIYEKLLRIPTLHYQRHFEEFQQLVLSTPLLDLLSIEEVETLKKHVLEGEDPDTSVRLVIIESRRVLHKQTETEAAKRWNFEQNIRRPYFHVKPLEASQIKNWSDYLAFEIEEKQPNRIIFLFERCLVACALYEDMWRKYLDYLKSQQQTDYVRYALQRVCTYHLSNKTALHLEWASFEEEEGNMDGAVVALQNGLKYLPNKAILALRQVGVVRRMQSDPDQVHNSFEHFVHNAEDVGLAEFFLIKEAGYYLKQKNDKDKAMEILRLGLKRDPTSNSLLTALIDCELQQIPLNMAAVVSIFEEIIAKGELTLQQKLDFLERKIHHLEDFGLDIKEIRAAHAQYYSMSGQVSRGRKRAFGEDEEEYVENHVTKKPFEAPPVVPVINNYNIPPVAVTQTVAPSAWPMAPPPATAPAPAFNSYPSTPSWPAGYGQGAWPPYQAAST